MHFRGVLIEPRGDLMLGLLDRHAVDMIDLFADRIILEGIRRTGERPIVVREIEAGRSSTDPSPATAAQRVCGDASVGRWRPRLAC